jgi:hypothetical protein
VDAPPNLDRQWALEVKQRCDEAQQQLANLAGTLRWMNGDVEPQQVLPVIDKAIRQLALARRACVDALERDADEA